MGTVLQLSHGVKTGNNGTSVTRLQLFPASSVVNSIVAGISAICPSLARFFSDVILQPCYVWTTKRISINQNSHGLSIVSVEKIQAAFEFFKGLFG